MALKKATGALTDNTNVMLSFVSELRNNEINVKNSPHINSHKSTTNSGGIISEHLENIQKLATKENVCIAIRPVNASASKLISLGFATKDMAIKGKSSDIPPLSGLVPRDQFYSKKGVEQETVKKFNIYNEDAIKQKVATTVELSLSATYLKELDGLEIIGTWINNTPERGPELCSGVMISKVEGRGEFKFWGEKKDDGSVKIFNCIDIDGVASKGMPIEVMGNQFNEPVTADYDLAFIAPSITDYGAEHTYAAKVSSYEEYASIKGISILNLSLKILNIKSLEESDFQTEKELVSEAKKKFISENVASQFKSEEYETLDYSQYNGESINTLDQSPPRKNLGNISSYTHKLIKKLNDACEVSRGKELFHHGDDAGNPVSEEKDNYPMTVILPSSSTLTHNLPTILMINNHDELSNLIQTLKDNNFQPPNAWGLDIKRASFNSARESLIRKIEEAHSNYTDSSDISDTESDTSSDESSIEINNSSFIYNHLIKV